MCSNNVCRQASPILPTVLFYSLSVLFSYPLSQPYTLTYTKVLSHPPLRTPFHYVFVIILSISLVCHLSRSSSLALLYADPTSLTQHIRKYMPSTAVVLPHFFAPLVRCSVMCRVLVSTKCQDCASQLLPQQQPFQSCTPARRTPE